MKLYISQNLLNSIGILNACKHFYTNNIPELFTYKNKFYVVVDTVFSGSKRFFSVTAYECILLENFKGKAVSYAQHGFDVIDGKSEKGYKNITFKSKNLDWVIIGEAIEFYPIIESTQIKLF